MKRFKLSGFNKKMHYKLKENLAYQKTLQNNFETILTNNFKQRKNQNFLMSYFAKFVVSYCFIKTH